MLGFILCGFYPQKTFAQPKTIKPSTGKAAIQAKLDTIVFSEVNALEGFSLMEVTDLIDKMTRRNDPAGGHINFLFAPPRAYVGLPQTNSIPPPLPLIDPNTGLPTSGLNHIHPSPWSPDILKVNGIVRPLRMVTLGQVLEIIVQSMDVATQFSVEEYGIVFRPVEIPLDAKNLRAEMEKLKQRLDRIEAENVRLRKEIDGRQGAPQKKL